MLNEKVFNEGMAILCAAFDREASTVLLKAYYMILSKMTDNQFRTAIKNVLETHTFSKMPLPAEIKEAVFGNGEEVALIALDKLEKAFGRVGAYNSVQFDDVIIHAVVSHLGGWPHLCSLDLDEWQFVKKDFLKAYKAFAAHPEELLSLPERCAGLAEISNSANGHPVEPEVIFIGHAKPPKQIEGGKDERRTLDIAHRLGEKLGTEKG